MGIYRDSVNGGCKYKRHEQIVGEGAKNTAHQDIGSFLAGRTHPQSDHLCSGSKRDDGCPDGSLTDPNNLSESKSTFHDGWSPTSHCRLTTASQQHRCPMHASS